MKTRQVMFWLVAVTLGACGGGGGGGGTPGSAAVPTDATGIWEGTSNTSGLILNFAGVVAENGESRFFDDNGTQYIVNNISGNDGSISLRFTAVAQFGFMFLDGSTVTNGTMTGTVVERTSINGSYSVATGEAGTISLTYNPLYERDSSFTKLSGSWDESGYGIMTVDPDGSFFEQDMFGCVYDGQASIIDSAYNVYDLTMTVSLCGADANGVYSGLGILTDYTVADDLLIVQMNSNNLIFTTGLLKL